ncbi:MAG: DNA-directed RNA polymerase subunit L [Candidatus Thermoplasmatota archaeon]
MEVKKISKTTKQLEVEVIDEDETILNPITETLLQFDDVDYASCMADHPMADNRRLYIRMKSGVKAKPEEALEKAIGQLEEEVEDFGKNFKKKK